MLIPRASEDLTRSTSKWLPGSRLEYVDFWLSLVQVEPAVVAETIVEVLLTPYPIRGAWSFSYMLLVQL